MIVKIVLQCILVNGSFDGLKIYGKVFICTFAVLCKLIRVGHHLKNYLCFVWCPKLSLQGDSAGCLAECDGVASCLPGRHLSCFVAVGSTGGI